MKLGSTAVRQEVNNLESSVVVVVHELESAIHVNRALYGF